MMMRRHYLTREDGFTLVEMIVVMVIFIVVIFITMQAFETALFHSKKISKSEESNIEGIIGLEILRHDLEQAGFGLFTAVDSVASPSYSEATGTAATYNDSTNSVSVVPRPVLAGNNITDGSVLSGTDYLAIKGTSVARNKTSQKWTYISGVGSSKTWGVNDLTTSEYVIAIEQKWMSGEMQKKLIYDTGNTSSFSVAYRSTAGGYSDPFGPPSDAKLYHYYGIDDVNPRAPFNRTDYYVSPNNSTTPSNCAPGAGVLYKTVMSQTTGAMSDIIPILDCVADMQVVFGWDAALTGGVDTYTDAAADGTNTFTTITGTAPWSPTSTILKDAAEVRKHLRVIKIYILAQDGGKDMTFVNTATAMRVGSDSDSALVSKTIDLTGANYKNYRWKLYRIVVKPKNIIQAPLVQ